MKIYDVPCTNTPLGVSAIDKLNSKINRVNSSLSNRISANTPYVETKDVYIGDTEAEFPIVKGTIYKALLISESGAEIPTELEVFENRIKVHFGALEEVGLLTIIEQ